jgi:succinate dehydrogenase/fumarate reductase flavoprotein subunit
MHHRHEMLDSYCGWKARGIIARNLAGEIERHSAHAVVASGGYGNVFSCQLMQWEVTLRQLGKYTRKGFLHLVTHKFTQHVFLFQEINQINFDVRIIA